MTWRVFVTDSCEADLEQLGDAERSVLANDLFRWVESGPPRSNRRSVAGAEVFEDRLAAGFVVTYFVDEQAPYVAILRVRRR
ncbi:MAG: hypothetical protein M3P53_07855 [Actinomycetota bacterium]|nr:hypothetical protein [Actinomycetota bacterium]